MLETPEFLRKSAENCGFAREVYDENKIPTSSHNIVVLPFFGDMRGTAVLSSMILKRYKEELRGSKYFILCSWPGHRIFYPYVDEFWSIKDNSVLPELVKNALRFRNISNVVLNYTKELNQCFYEVVNPETLEDFYYNGLTDKFGEKFKSIRRFLPLIPSKGILNTELNKAMVNRSGYKIMVYPSLYIKAWKHQRVENIKSPKAFWVAFVNRLFKEGLVPVVAKNAFTHDLEIEPEKAIVLAEYDFSKILSAMRAVDCVVDVFNDISRYATIARSPFLCCIERLKYMGEKDYEIDDLCAENLPKQYIFSFPTILEKGSEQAWEVNLFDNIVVRLKAFLANLNDDNIPSGSEVDEEVSYKKVRVRKIKSFGSKFIKVPKDG